MKNEISKKIAIVLLSFFAIIFFNGTILQTEIQESAYADEIDDQVDKSFNETGINLDEITQKEPKTKESEADIKKDNEEYLESDDFKNDINYKKEEKRTDADHDKRDEILNTEKERLDKEQKTIDNYNLGSTTFNLKKNFQLSDSTNADYLNKTPIKIFIFTRVIEPAIKLMGTIAVIVIIIGGFILITAQGESDQIDKGKDILKYAIIGLVIALFSYVIVISTQSIFSGNTTEETQSTNTN